MSSSHKPVSFKKILDLPVIESVGGLVCNKHHHILLMFKRGKWDLPKGRTEPDQSYKETAMREVQEEIGLDKTKLVVRNTLVSTWHTTTHKNQGYLKKTHWYLMEYQGLDDDAIPQVKEGIIECRWVCLSDLPRYRELLRPRVEYVVDFWHQNLAYVPRT